MATSPLARHVDILTTKLLVDGSAIDEKFHVTSIQTTAQVNKIPRATITIKDGELVNPHFPNSDGDTFAIGKEIEIKAGYHSDEASIYKGIIVQHGLTFGKSSGSVIVLECKNIAAKMTIARRTRTFVEKTDSDVIQEIFSENGIEGEVETTDVTYPKIVQYAATDWDFILMRAERNGMIITFKEGKMKVAPPEVEGEPIVGLTYGKDIYSLKANINAEHQLNNYTYKAWDIPSQELIEGEAKPPKVNEQGKTDDSNTLAGEYELEEIVATSSAPLLKDDLQATADAKLQKSHLARILGEVSFQGCADARVGELIEILGIGDRFSGNAFISKVNHDLRRGRWVTRVSFGLKEEWFSVKTQDIHAPAAGGLLPAIGGLHIATVKQIEEDPEGESRILVNIPAFGEDTDGTWARMANLYATTGHGFYFIPEVDDEVIIGFLNEDPRFPVILGSLYSSSKAPPYETTADNFIKAIALEGSGGSFLKLEFDKEKDIIIIETPAGNRITLDDDQKAILLEDINQNIVTLNDQGISLETPKDFVVDAKGKATITAVNAIELKASGGDVKIEGINVQAKGQSSVKAEGTMVEVKGSAQTTIKGGIVMIN